MNSDADVKFRVAICGAGVAGLTAAVALSAYTNIEIEVYESAAEISDIGAGIGIFPRPWDVLRRLGLEEELLRHSKIEQQEGLVPCFRYRKSDQNPGVEFYTLWTNGNLMLFRRADFQQILLRKLSKSCQTHCSKRLRSYTQRPESGKIEILFKDGSSTVCDVLIGADGLKSAVRRSFVDEKVALARLDGRDAEVAGINASMDPIWTGTCAYRGLISTEKLQFRSPNHRVMSRPTQYLGKNGYVIAYPVTHGKFINFAAFTMKYELENTPFHGPWVTISNRDEVSRAFSNWEPEVQDLIESIDDPLRWAVHTVKPLDSFVSDHVALIGDAAHAMAPHQGSGAGQAIEDAYVLASILGHPSTRRETLSRALAIFDRVRRPRALEVAEKSRLNGQLFTLYNRNFDNLTMDMLLEALKSISEGFTESWKWAWTTSVDESLEEALHLLELGQC